MLSVVDLRTGATCPPDFNLAQHVLEENGAPNDKIALNILSLSGAERWSYGRLRSAVRGMSAGLKGAGLEPGTGTIERQARERAAQAPLCIHPCTTRRTCVGVAFEGVFELLDQLAVHVGVDHVVGLVTVHRFSLHPPGYTSARRKRFHPLRGARVDAPGPDAGGTSGCLPGCQ